MKRMGIIVFTMGFTIITSICVLSAVCLAGMKTAKPGKDMILPLVTALPQTYNDLSGARGITLISQDPIEMANAAALPVSYNLGQRASSISDFKYTKEYTMLATAYTAGPESTGKSPGMRGYGVTASGMRVQPGVVAVDPRVIPLGTRLYVQGYGYSIAADTGKAIKGNRIDVYKKTLSEAYGWGRKTVSVYILKK